MTSRFLIVVAVSALAALASCARYPAPEPAATPVPVRDSVIIALPAPASAVAPSSQVKEYRGAFSSAFEVSWFEPCGAPFGDNLWWVTLTEDARLQRDSLVKLLPRKPREGLAVRWRATVSDKMPAGAGQMGRGSRYMLVTKVISVRALGPEGACSREERET